MLKPILWNYKSGKKKGKLREKSKKYLSFRLKEYHKRIKIIKSQFIKKEKKEYFRSLIQVKFNGKNKNKGEYDFMKVRIWINDFGEHSEQELRNKLRDLDKKLKIHFGSGIAKGSVFYEVSYELEEISVYEADSVGNFQYFVNIKGWEDEGYV